MMQLYFTGFFLKDSRQLKYMHDVLSDLSRKFSKEIYYTTYLSRQLLLFSVYHFAFRVGSSGDLTIFFLMRAILLRINSSFWRMVTALTWCLSYQKCYETLKTKTPLVWGSTERVSCALILLHFIHAGTLYASGNETLRYVSVLSAFLTNCLLLILLRLVIKDRFLSNDRKVY